jgi:NAD(P)-dependent dehydrogenase (short-subunit alcohol dehydrogenase family)
VACYAAAKAALLSLTRSTALEGKARRIRANAVLPGAVDTPMLWNNPNIVSGVEHVNRVDVGRPEDIASVVAFLASDDAQFVQGASLRADGGRLDHL